VSAKFDAWLTATAESDPAQREALLREWARAPHARDSHPPGGEEHLLPLLVAAGAGADSPGRNVYSEEVMSTTLSAFRFG
jgi:aromatic ring-opening dioxygenase catalytic subunit (LigB family)